jgi:hypothetical protein
MTEALKVVYFDVETIPDYSRTHLFEADVETRVEQEFTRKRQMAAAGAMVTLPDVPEDAKLSDIVEAAARDEARKRIMATTPEFCQIVGLNYGLNENAAGSGWVGQIPEGLEAPLTESDLLKSFWKLVRGADHLVGYNCLEFDLNALLVRSAICGVTPSRELWRVKPWEDTVIDVMKRRYGMRARERYLSLKALRRIHQLPIASEYADILGMTGEQVHELYLNAEYTKLERYGKLDIVTTRELARMWGGYYFPVIAPRFIDWDYLTASKKEPQ